MGTTRKISDTTLYESIGENQSFVVVDSDGNVSRIKENSIAKKSELNVANGKIDLLEEKVDNLEVNDGQLTIKANGTTLGIFSADQASNTNVDIPVPTKVSDLTNDIGYSPTGSITMFPSDTPPTGWLICNGQAVSRTTYAALFAIIGTKYGTGNGSTTFNVPNFQGRFAVGRNATYPLANTGGEASHTLTTDEMPSHSHLVNDPGHHHATGTMALTYSGIHYGPASGAYTENPVATSTATTGISIHPNGGSQAHNNMPPYLSVNYIIKV